jgi:hypothetical protein
MFAIFGPVKVGHIFVAQLHDTKEMAERRVPHFSKSSGIR